MHQSQDRLSAIFQHFSDSQRMSPFYSMLAGCIASDPDVLAVAAHARPGQPPPNMLFGAVMLLLDRGASPELLACYPTTPEAPVGSRSYSLFRQFVLDNRREIAAVLERRSVQSNVVRRAAVLLLGLMKVSQINGRVPFANIEIGASFGMTLLWQKFSYEYGPGPMLGNLGSQVHIRTKLTGKSPFAVSPTMPQVVSNTGIEIAPVEVDDPESLAWLEALIWPDHQDNRDLWRAAASVALQDPPRVLAGDAVELLPGMIDAVEAGMPVSVYHSHTLNQFSLAAKTALEEMLCRMSVRRPISRISFEAEAGGARSFLHVFSYSGGQCTGDLYLADCEPHGRWIEWRGEPLS
jgi:hypothetical protein